MPSTTPIQTSPQSPTAFANESEGPAVGWLVAGLILSGMGTVMLGPILPTLAHHWHLRDADSGLLFLAKFTGAFAGGVSVPRKLRHGILLGLLASAIGFASFSFCEGLVTGMAALFVSGVGLGLIIASTNILAGRRYRARTGSALALLNFFWSFGAVSTGIFLGALLPHVALNRLLLSFAAIFILVAIGGSFSHARAADEDPATPDGLPAQTIPLGRTALITFALLLFFYGGLETSLTQWLTTYSVRYTTGHILGGQSAIVLMWSALTAGRALTSLLLRRISERTLQRGGLALSLGLIPVLANTSTAGPLALCCIALGLSMSPFFPTTFALLMRRRPSARAAGFILAVSGLGAAAVSYGTGVVSTHFGSLRAAMAVPALTAACLLLVSFWPAKPLPTSPVSN